jgi:hypothetical protein
MGKVEDNRESSENETTKKIAGEAQKYRWPERFREKCHVVRRKWGEETEGKRTQERQTVLVASGPTLAELPSNKDTTIRRLYMNQ